MASTSFSPPSSFVFNGENYHIWVVKMKTYLQAYNLWEVVNTNVKLAPLRDNTVVAQIKHHSDKRAKRYKVMSYIQNGISNVIFTRIGACTTPKEAWDKLKEEFQGFKKTGQQELINLIRDFENLKMNEAKTIKQYAAKIMAVVNNIRLLGEEFTDSKVVEKVITTFPERCESKISSLEDLRDLSIIFLSKLINALYAQEQRRASRHWEHAE
ncbi:uncharacterized protein LOC108466128 [Gossypium arboreum]|uniref:uncharacterized protein LOC108466128 n=1 Tax=Gossypium arboreum TaxID=29729 RepID=UPI00081903AA|nr:uncharacterized protein LOC108466128 [Gossypium arboreum]